MKDVLITGGAGFVGTALIRELLSQQPNIEITSVDNYSSGSKNNHVSSEQVMYIDADTRTLCPVTGHYTGSLQPDTVFHFGEFSRITTSFDQFDQCWEYNMQGTRRVLDYCVAKKARLIYSASSSKFGNQGADENLSPYAWMKAKMVELIKNYSTWFGLEYEIVYFYNVYGPGQICSGDYATVIGIFEEQYKNNQPLTVVSPGNQSRDFTHVDDIVRGVIAAVDKGAQGEYSLGTGTSHTILDVVKMFDHEHVMIPERTGERLTGKADNTTAQQQLGWLPTVHLKDYIKKIKLNNNIEMIST